MSTAPRCKRCFSTPFFSASRMRQTHVENLSQSDKTNVSNALFMNNTNLVACQSSHVLPSLAYVSRFAGGPFFEFSELHVEMSFQASTRAGHQSRSRRFEATPFCDGFTARSAGVSVVEPIEAESPIVSDHHINLLQTSSSFLQSSIASCVSPSSLPVRGMSAESASASENQSNVSCSSSCFLGSYFKRRRLEMTRKRGNTFEGMQENIEFGNFEKSSTACMASSMRKRWSSRAPPTRHLNRNSTRKNFRMMMSPRRRHPQTSGTC